MGTDCTIVVERLGKYGWEAIGLMNLPRCYDLFADMRGLGIAGYPRDVDTVTKLTLEAVEDWGEGYMSYDEFKKLIGKYEIEDVITIKRKYHSDCRVIYRFDN